MLEREGIGIETGVYLVLIAMLVAHGNSVIWNCTKASTCNRGVNKGEVGGQLPPHPHPHILSE